jgi:hypothetical protein
MSVHCPLDLSPGPHHVTLVVALERVLRLASEDSSIRAAAPAFVGSGASEAVLSYWRGSSWPGCQIGEAALQNTIVSLASLGHQKVEEQDERESLFLVALCRIMWMCTDIIRLLRS